MATSSSTTHNVPVHDGVERVIEGATALKDTVIEASAGKRLPSYMVGFTIMVLVTLTARALDESRVGFVTELLALSAVALLAFVFLSSVVRAVTRNMMRFAKETLAAIRAARADERLWAYAAQDSRVMNDIVWAKTRDEALLVEESRAPAHPTQREILAERRMPSPIFMKYY